MTNLGSISKHLEYSRVSGVSSNRQQIHDRVAMSVPTDKECVHPTFWLQRHVIRQIRHKRDRTLKSLSVPTGGEMETSCFWRVELSMYVISVCLSDYRYHRCFFGQVSGSMKLKPGTTVLFAGMWLWYFVDCQHLADSASTDLRLCQDYDRRLTGVWQPSQLYNGTTAAVHGISCMSSQWHVQLRSWYLVSDTSTLSQSNCSI